MKRTEKPPDEVSLTRAELLAHNVRHCDPSVHNGLRFQDVLIMAVPSRPFIWDAPAPGTGSPLISINLFKHSCLVKKGQVAFKIKICIWHLLNVISKALIIFILHLSILQTTFLRSCLIWVPAARGPWRKKGLQSVCPKKVPRRSGKYQTLALCEATNKSHREQ